MGCHRAAETATKRTVAEFLFDAVVGSIVSLVVLVTLKLIIPRIPKS